MLLLRTPESLFVRLVPILIFGATVLLAGQELVTRRLGVLARAHENPTRGWVTFVFLFQFAVAVYGGYFGAGMGILMLAALGLIGMADLHQMNGLKNTLGLCINGVASVYFIWNGMVSWLHVMVMVLGAMTGGVWGAGVARRVGPPVVRRVVIAVGFTMAISLLFRL